jgi:hypothetical protein
MRLVRLAAALRTRIASNEHTAVLDAHVVDRNTILFVPRLAAACPKMELPVVPGTNDVFTGQIAFSKRPPDVTADAGHCSKLAITVGQRDLDVPDHHLLHRSLGEFLACTHVYPRIGRHAYSSLAGEIAAYSPTSPSEPALTPAAVRFNEAKGDRFISVDCR